MTDGSHRVLVHIATADEWAAAQDAGEVRPPSLATEGFVHCSWDHQVAATVERHMPGRTDLLLLHLDPAELGAPLVEEDSYRSGSAYPHVYGPVPVAAVVAVVPFNSPTDPADQ